MHDVGKHRSNNDSKTGVISLISQLGNYGFIEGDDGHEYFWHISSMRALKRPNIQEGEKVSFRVIEDPVKPNSLNAGDIIILSEYTKGARQHAS